jgi:hypothetical protein
MFTVCSAGNSGSSSWYYIGAPADADSVLAVGAVDASGNIASFSSRGPSYDGRVKPNVCAQGLNSIVASPSGGTQTASGTSFSSPITCGAVACLWQANPTFTNMQLFNAIQMSATQYTSPDNDYGYGIPDFCLANILLANGGNLDEFTGDALMEVYPNPFIDEISFSFFSLTEQSIAIEIIDISGRKVIIDSRTVRSKSVNMLQGVNLSALGDGVYFLRIVSASGTFTKKLVKQ